MPSGPSLTRALGRLLATTRRAEPGRASDRWSGPRRPDCPWCGSGRLEPAPVPPGVRRPVPRPAVVAARCPRPRPVAAPDPAEGPGGPADTARFDACADCGHVFRNPRHTTGEPASRSQAASLLARRLTARSHRSAARALLPCPEPESWLDVGTADGGFPAAAREFFPYTAFDGVDAGHRVVRAQAAERVEEAHVGRLTDPHLTARLRARYDVVSMLHHLERAPDPRAELHAALTVLRPGGHLLLDVTDPHAAWWTPPVHPAGLHLPPRANIEADLRSNGFTTVTPTTRGPLPGTYRVLARRD